MNKVYIAPDYSDRPERADGGIRRVVDAMRKYLPTYGWQVVSDIAKADVINCHAAEFKDYHGTPIVASNHGLYWSEYQWPEWCHTTNAGVVQVLSAAKAVTVPSRWVAHALVRGMLCNPKVIYHGVDVGEWKPARSPGDYVLWNKARADPVSNPEDMQKLASILFRRRFVTTIGQPTDNVSVVGVKPWAQMKALVEGAGVQLVTSRETFGILTLEALAAGVPVVGWDFGGQAEIIEDGVTGYLAPYGDYDMLAQLVEKAFAERDRLSANCRQDAVDNWQWPDKVAKYADLFTQVLEGENQKRPKVSVVVTAHNLAHYLPDTLRSIQAQTLKDWEVIVVDDCSADDPEAVVKEMRDPRIRYVRTPTNLRLCGALNFGFKYTRGKYILNLDADNLLPPPALSMLSGVLDDEPGVHIVYGHIDMMWKDGTEYKRNNWPFDQFSWWGQMAHLNQVHSSALVRREVHELSGGYRKRHVKAEDAWYWAYVTSLGFRAEKVTEAATLIYRVRPDSKSAGEGGDGDWVAEFPWAIAHSANEAEANQKDHGGHLYLARPGTVPWSAQGVPPQPMFWNVPHCADPDICVTVTANGDGEALLNTLDSIMLQSFKNWECVVMGDPGDCKLPLWLVPVQSARREITVKAGQWLEMDMLEKIMRWQPQ